MPIPGPYEQAKQRFFTEIHSNVNGGFAEKQHLRNRTLDGVFGSAPHLLAV
jgi:hypothetical protein